MNLQEAKEKARGRAVKIAKVSGYKLGAFGYMFDAGWNAATEHHAAKAVEMEAEIERLRAASEWVAGCEGSFKPHHVDTANDVIDRMIEIARNALNDK